MGSRVHLVCLGSDEDVRWAAHEVARLEALWSRFLPDSDVSRVNRAAGAGPVRVAPETFALVRDACAWWAATDGWFDPTVLGALVALGYDAPFAEVRARPARAAVVRSAPRGLPTLEIPVLHRGGPGIPAPGCAGIRLDAAASTVALPAGVGLDLGGIGKGAAADRVVAGLAARGVPAACVSLGGDVRAFGAGNGPGGCGWAIPVEDPLDETRTLFTWPVGDGAVVTSTDRFRRWVHEGAEQHHLVDPTTGVPAEPGIVAVIAADRSCARAEVLAKAAFVAGPARGTALLARHGVDAWFVDTRGACVRAARVGPPPGGPR